MIPLDVRQSIYRGILQQLLPNLSAQQVDTLLESVDSDLTPPLRVDASNPADHVVTIGPSIISNPNSDRQRSLSFVGNVIPEITSETVTIPTTDGGTVSSSTGQSFPLNCPSGNYAKILLSIDSSANIQISQGLPNAVLATASLPPPGTTFTPFAYLIVHNTAGSIDSLTQASIVQLQAGGGGGGSGGGIAQEVSLTSGTTSQVVTFPAPLTTTSYTLLAQVINLTDLTPQFIPITITNKSATGFTASWNTPLDSSNYKLDYIVPGIQEQFGESVLLNGDTTKTITLPIAMANTSYVVIANLINTVDGSVQYQPVTITNKTNTTFSASWNVPVDSSNYRLSYNVAAYQ